MGYGTDADVPVTDLNVPVPGNNGPGRKRRNRKGIPMRESGPMGGKSMAHGNGRPLKAGAAPGDKGRGMAVAPGRPKGMRTAKGGGKGGSQAPC